MSVKITTDRECVEKFIAALPFADEKAGLKETADLIRMLYSELNTEKAKVVVLEVQLEHSHNHVKDLNYKIDTLEALIEDYEEQKAL